MNRRAECVLYSADADLASRWSRLLESVCAPRRAATPAELDAAVGGLGGAVALLDLRAPDAPACLERLAARPIPVVILAIGAPRSEPAREAEARGVFATLAPDEDWRNIEHLVVRALERADLEIELRALRETAAAGPPPAARRPRALSLDPFAAALRHLRDVEPLLQHVVEGIAQAAGVARVGIFAGGRDALETFRLRADRHCLADAQSARFPPGDPLVEWLARNAHVVSRSALDRIGAPADRPMLGRALDRMGAEAVVPLFARGRLIGWFSAGRRADGAPFDSADLEDLSQLAGPGSTAIDNALLHEELAFQKTFAETLLDGIPVGIVAADAEGVVRWFNRAAERLLDRRAGEVLGRPAERAGSRPADLLRRTLEGEPPEEPVEWGEPGGRRFIGSVFRLAAAGGPGAMLLIEDVSEKRRLAERAEELNRSAFWTELAGAMAHEIRNPLVAVQTFAQLLPERYQDEEFRREFSREVSGEVARLATIADQIAALARPPKREPAVLDLPDVLTRAVEAARTQVGRAPATIEARILDSVPPVTGDEASLRDALARLIVNALESIPGNRAGRVEVTVARDDGPAGPMAVFRIEDNGRGFGEGQAEKAFSPFVTSKARGLGLGLPIARRVALDHDGDLRIESLRQGTRVTLRIPAGPSAAEAGRAG